MRFKEGDLVVVVVDSEINDLRKGDITTIVGFAASTPKESLWKVSTSKQRYYDSELELAIIYDSPLMKALR